MTGFTITPASPTAAQSKPQTVPRNILNRPIELPPMRNIKDGIDCAHGDPYCPCNDGDPCNHEEDE